jgi:hypothetical protein
MILPFGDANATEYRLKYQNAAIVVRNVLETAFMERGFKTIHCPSTFSSEASLGKQGIREEQAVEIGKQGGADIVLFGVVTEFYKGSFWGDYTTVGFIVKAMSKQEKLFGNQV